MTFFPAPTTRNPSLSMWRKTKLVSKQGAFLSSLDTITAELHIPHTDYFLLTWAWQLPLSLWMASFLELGQAEKVPDFKHCFYRIV